MENQITYQVDHYVLLKGLSVFNGERSHFIDRLYIIRVHMNYRYIKGLAKLSGVFIGSLVLGDGGIANLIINHHMNGSLHLF